MRAAVLVMAYGTPASATDIADFYTDVRHGHPPSAEQLRNLERRYAAIGGVSPLSARTDTQIAELQRALDAHAPETFTTFYGTKHATPSIEQSIGDIARQGLEQLVGLVLAPHYSILSVGEYIERARTCAREFNITPAFIERWGDDPALIELLATRVNDARESMNSRCRRIEVVFTAHSLPRRILDLADRYPDELYRTAELVAGRIGIDHFRVAWQSAGRTAEPWLEPDLLSLLDELADEGVDGVVVCPAGFTSDHLEVLYDLDIEASERARELGLVFARTRSLNDDRSMAALLARRVIALATTGQGG